MEPGHRDARQLPTRRRPPAMGPSPSRPVSVVRDLPGTGLVRVSVGWWTSDEDLDRLPVAAL